MNRDTMTGSPFFSIGLTTYDRVDLLRESVQSVLAQSFGDFEIIIGNDGSDRTLTSADLQTDDPRIRIVNNEETLGQVGNWRALLGAARGTYFGWIADDDLYAPDLLKACHKALEGHGRPEGVFTAFTLLEGTDSTPPSPGFSGKIDVCSGHDLVTGYLLDELPLLGNMGFFRPNFLKNCVPWEQMECPGIALFREYLFVLGSIGAEKVLYLPDPLVIYRDHADSWGSSNTNVAQYIEAGQWLVEQGSHMLQAIADPRVRWQMTLLLFHLALRQLVQKRKNASFNLDVRGLMRDFLKADESSPADELSRRVYLALSGQYADAEVSRIEKEVEIHEKELEIHEKEVEIHEKELEIHEKEVEIHEMGAEASKRSLKVESLTEESGGLQDQLEATSAELKAISLEATRRQDQLEVATEEAENRQQIINKIQKTNQELIQTID
ncbi:MAG: glycosyltransferase, partial [Candidatus Latescibacteria bacterium]|nr:glycosyltransferase [Candidatus Latescibacterota bacterium]